MNIQKYKKEIKEELIYGIVVGLIPGIVSGLIYGIVVGLIYGLTTQIIALIQNNVEFSAFDFWGQLILLIIIRTIGWITVNKLEEKE